MCYSILVETDLKKLQDQFGARPDREAFQRFAERAQEDPKTYKRISAHPRIFPKYWAPVIVNEGGERVIRPMRYRLRPFWADKEPPSRYNLFNARLDALEKRRSWRPLFMKRHGLLVFRSFFEWVTGDDGKKKVIQFSPRDQSLLWAPALYDSWPGNDDTPGFESFAIITGDPPPEVEAAGHDRCPIFLSRERIDDWLAPEGRTKEDGYRILSELEPVYYEHADAA